MAELISYLSFDNTKEALAYYKEVFGATNIHRVAVSKAQAANFGVAEDQADDFTMHAEFEILGNKIMAADNFRHEAINYSGFTLIITVDAADLAAVAELDKLWEKLEASGQVTIEMPYAEQFWGGKLGSVKDKYGVRWQLNAYAEQGK